MFEPRISPLPMPQSPLLHLQAWPTPCRVCEGELLLDFTAADTWSVTRSTGHVPFAYLGHSHSRCSGGTPRPHARPASPDLARMPPTLGAWALSGHTETSRPEPLSRLLVVFNRHKHHDTAIADATASGVSPSAWSFKGWLVPHAPYSEPPAKTLQYGYDERCLRWPCSGLLLDQDFAWSAADPDAAVHTVFATEVWEFQTVVCEFQQT